MSEETTALTICVNGELMRLDHTGDFVARVELPAPYEDNITFLRLAVRDENGSEVEVGVMLNEFGWLELFASSKRNGPLSLFVDSDRLKPYPAHWSKVK